MVLGTAGLIAAGALIGGAATGITMGAAAASNKPKVGDMPKAPKVEQAVDAAAGKAKRKMAALQTSGRSVYSSPLGAAGEAGVAKKTLLGQ